MDDIITHRGYKPMFAIKNCVFGKAYYFNPRIDFLRITTDCYLFGNAPAIKLTNKLVNKKDLEQVANLTVDLPIVNNNSDAIMKAIKKMKDLTSLMICGTIRSSYRYYLDTELLNVGTRFKLQVDLEEVCQYGLGSEDIRHLVALEDLINEKFVEKGKTLYRIAVKINYRP